MEQKINNQKIFRYVPSLIARLILDSNLQDKDIFSEGRNEEPSNVRYPLKRKPSKIKSTFLTTSFINTNIYPISHPIENTLVMNIRLKGFQKLISTLSIKDPKDQKEKLVSEYLSMITPKILLKISKIISNYGGEIIKYNDYEFTTIWNFKPKKRLLRRYQKFYSKQAILSAYQIMKEVDNTEITSGIRVKISIGLAMGQTLIVFFGGERRRGEYIVMGDTIQKAEICLSYCLNHEVIISEEINDLYKESDEIYTKKIKNEENANLFVITNFREDLLKNFHGFKIRMKYDKLKLTKDIYENLANKVYIFSSILPQGLVKYLDVGQDENLKEISVVTIATIHIKLNQTGIDYLSQIQNIILDIQKSTYLTFGSLLYISKTYNGLLVRCVWGMDPGSFLDDTARSITTAKLIGSLTEYYDIKIGIGISTGSCYIGLIPLQGDRKQFTLLGKKVNLSRTLADEAFQRVIDKNTKIKYCIFCDKKTMRQSQKWYRHIYISQMNIYFNIDSQELYYETKEEFKYNPQDQIVKNVDNDNNYKPNFKETKKEEEKNSFSKFSNSYKIVRNNTSLFGEYNRQHISHFKNCSNKNDNLNEKTHKIVREIYSPVELEEYFIPNIYDTFPLIRTHRNNSYSPKNKNYFNIHLKNVSYGHKIILSELAQKAKTFELSEEEQKKMKDKFDKSNIIFGHENDIVKLVNIMKTVTKKNRKQIILIKGPLGIGKSLFLRNSLNIYMENNEELKKIHLNEEEFIFCNKLDPLIVTFPYNTFCFIFRKLFFHLKRHNLLEELCENTRDINLDDENIGNINFILSMGKKDINIKEEFNKALKQNNLTRGLRNRYTVKSNKNHLRLKNMSSSVLSNLEGPHKVKDSNKINNFFYEMIKIYKIYLNKKYNKSNSIKSTKIKNKVPMILVIDDVHVSDKNSIDFIRYLFNNDEKSNNPFIIILVEQTPFNKNFSPLSHRELEFFLSAFSEYDEKIGKDKIMCFDLKPFYEKNNIQDIIIQTFNNYIIKNYDTKVTKIDDRILDFLLMKSFQGTPLLFISLFDSLLKSQKYIKVNESNSELEITKDLLDDNEVFDWGNLLIPYVYEKISSMMINNLLTFKEILLLKYACTIGTIFDIQTLDKINPLNILIKTEDLFHIIQKLCDEYIVEIFDDENIIRKNKKFLICKICYPFMREVLIQKFPIERRAGLHAKTAKLLTGGKKMYFFNSKTEGKIVRRHLIYSEIDVVKEIESKIGKNIPETYKNTKIMNSDNLTVLFVKDICSRIFDRKFKNVLEGDLEAKVEEKWEKISYFIDRSWKIHFKIKINIDNNVEEFELKAPIKDIYKNTILEDGKTLELILIEYSFYIQNEQKEKAYVRSDDPLDIFHLDTAITFLKVIANYEKYINNFGYTHFPLYKPSTYERKEKKYYANFEKNQISYFDNLNPNKRKRLLSCFGLDNRTDRLIHESKDLKKPFYALMHIALSIFLAKIQVNLTKKRIETDDDENEEARKLIHGKNVYLIYLPISPHIREPIRAYLEDFIKKEKEEEDLARMRRRNKYSMISTSLLKEERRILGGSVNVKRRRNQSICEIKPLINDIEEVDEEENNENNESKEKENKEVKENKEKKEEENKEFFERRKGKFRTYKEKKETLEEVEEENKNNTSIEFIDYTDSQSQNVSKSKSRSNSSSSESKSSESSEDKSSNSESTESPVKHKGLRYNNENKLSQNIKTIKSINNEDNNKSIEKKNSFKSNSSINNSPIKKNQYDNESPAKKRSTFTFEEDDSEYDNKSNHYIEKKDNNENNNNPINNNNNENEVDSLIARKSSFKRNTNNYTKKFIKFNFKENKENAQEDNYKSDDNNNINIKASKENYSKFRNAKNANDDKKFNINNYINNNININVIGNNYLSKTLKNSLINNNSLQNKFNNRQNTDASNLRMSYQKEANKFRSKSIKTLMKKYHSYKLRSIKEKYLNDVINYCRSNSSHKLSLDKKEEDSLGDKDSDNNDSNNNESNNIFIITTPGKTEKKNSKGSFRITSIKDDMFVKILLAILGEDNGELSSPIKNDSSMELNHSDKKDKNKINLDNKDNQQNNKNKKIPFKSLKSFNMDNANIIKTNSSIQKKRSSLRSPFKLNFNKDKTYSRRRHVTFKKNRNEKKDDIKKDK